MKTAVLYSRPSNFAQKCRLAGALFALVPLAQSARAQSVGAMERAANVMSAPAPTARSGSDLLLDAGQLLKANPPIAANEKPLPAEVSRRQKLEVARNAPALAALRGALKAGITLPPDFFVNSVARTELPRRLARQLALEADVRAQSGDALGAAQADLDALDLAGQISGGPLLGSLIGVAIAASARNSLEQHAAMLSATQSREVAARWEQTSAKMPAFVQVLRGEEANSAPRFLQMIAVLGDAPKRAQAQAELDGGTLSPADAKAMREILALTVPGVQATWRELFDQAVARAATPYALAARAAPLSAANLYVKSTAELLSAPRTRFSFERDVAANRLLVAALKLHAAKLDGAYPDKFDAGVDPFSPTLAPLVYRRQGEKYLLYSVGPDGVDDGGKAIQKNARVPDELETGDIVAAVF